MNFQKREEKNSDFDYRSLDLLQISDQFDYSNESYQYLYSLVRECIETSTSTHFRSEGHNF